MKCVLITGATGVVGSSLAPLFLAEDDTQVRLIMRAESEIHLRQRRDELFAFWELSPKDNRLAGRVELLRGDVAEPHLRLDEATYARLLSEATHVVHAAGNVKLNRSLAEARRDAVVPLREIVTFCRNCRPFRKLDYISTVGVAGRLHGLVSNRRLLGRVSSAIPTNMPRRTPRMSCGPPSAPDCRPQCIVPAWSSATRTPARSSISRSFIIYVPTFPAREPGASCPN